MPETCLFLPGIIQPAAVRYGPLIRELGSATVARTKELEVYAVSPPPDDYAVTDEVEGLRARAERLGLRRFHLYGHSGGGAVALAFAATHPAMLLSLAVDEPAFDFSPEAVEELAPHLELRRDLLLDPQRAFPAFVAHDLRPGVEATPAPGPPPLPNRPAGVSALLGAFSQHRVDVEAFRSFEPPVLFTRGTLSAERFERMSARLAALFPRFEEVVFEGLSHVNTSHQAEPRRVAALLRDLWTRAAAAG